MATALGGSKHIQKEHTEQPQQTGGFDPRTFMLWSNSANHCTTLLPCEPLSALFLYLGKSDCQRGKDSPIQPQKKLFQSLHCCLLWSLCLLLSFIRGFWFLPTSPISSPAEVKCIMQIQTVTVPAWAAPTGSVQQGYVKWILDLLCLQQVTYCCSGLSAALEKPFKQDNLSASRQCSSLFHCAWMKQWHKGFVW